ncbi:MAG: pre-peptidase C-terminal domain-containing protein [Acidobacteria bacterium]|nr:pre-peptidase C-terminal domain-containing protein [Acidobacteriota bacterium]
METMKRPFWLPSPRFLIVACWMGLFILILPPLASPSTTYQSSPFVDPEWSQTQPGSKLRMDESTVESDLLQKEDDELRQTWPLNKYLEGAVTEGQIQATLCRMARQSAEAAHSGNAPRLDKWPHFEDSHHPDFIQESARQQQCTAQIISVPQTVQGALEFSDCRFNDGSYVDIYYFVGSAKQSVDIQLSSSIFDTYLILATDSGTVLATNDDSFGSNSRITRRLSATRGYFIFANSYAANRTGSYTLTLAGDQPVSPSQCGQSSTPITFSETKTGLLDSSDCRLSDGSYADLFSFDGEGGQLVTIELNSTVFDPLLILTTSTGLPVTCDDDSGDGTNARATFLLPQTGGYVLFANSFASGRTGPYSVRLTSCSGQQVRIPQNVTGALSAGDCALNDGSYVDVYTFQGRAGQRVDLQLNATAFDPFLFLAREGQLIASNNDIGGGNRNSRITMTLTAGGKYQILANSTTSGRTGEYQLAALGDPGQSFTLGVSPASQSGFPGHSVQFSVMVEATGSSSQPVTLEGVVTPSGTNISTQFSPASLSPGTSSTLTVNLPSDTPVGSYLISIIGTAAGESIQIPATIQVADFSITAGPPSQTVEVGMTTRFNLSVQGFGPFSEPVTVSTSVNPPVSQLSVTLSASVLRPGETAMVTVSPQTGTQAGTYTLTVLGSVNQVQRMATVTVTVLGPDFEIQADPATVTVSRNQSAEVRLAINRIRGFSGAVTITPPDVRSLKCKLSPASVNTAGNSATFQLKAKSKAPIGTQSLVFTGRDDSGRIRTGTLTLVIQ